MAPRPTPRFIYFYPRVGGVCTGRDIGRARKRKGKKKKKVKQALRTYTVFERSHFIYIIRLDVEIFREMVEVKIEPSGSRPCPFGEREKGKNLEAIAESLFRSAKKLSPFN